MVFDTDDPIGDFSGCQSAHSICVIVSVLKPDDKKRLGQFIWMKSQSRLSVMSLFANFQKKQSLRCWGANSCVQASKKHGCDFCCRCWLLPLRTSLLAMVIRPLTTALWPPSQCDTSSLLYAKTEGFSFFASRRTYGLRSQACC